MSADVTSARKLREISQRAANHSATFSELMENEQPPPGFIFPLDTSSP